jgi:hypothetical protein
MARTEPWPAPVSGPIDEEEVATTKVRQRLLAEVHIRLHHNITGLQFFAPFNKFLGLSGSALLLSMIRTPSPVVATS